MIQVFMMDIPALTTLKQNIVINIVSVQLPNVCLSLGMVVYPHGFLGMNLKIFAKQKGQEKKKIFQALDDLLNNREVRMFKKCLPPCVTINIKLQKTRHERHRLNEAWLTAVSKDLATKLTEVYSYDQFDFVVDFGSALGLWLGLSCLSILDNILEMWMSVKKYWKK